MLMLAVLAVAMATVPLLGGRVTALTDLRLRLAWTVPLALVVQVLVISVAPGADGPLALLHLASYVVGAAFLAANLRLPGAPVIALGAALNGAAIFANGGVMPADPGAVARAGIVHPPGEFANSAAVADARLAFLGDVFAWPAPLPLANVFSVGDIVLVIGTVVLLHRACGTRLARRGPGPDIDPATAP